MDMEKVTGVYLKIRTKRSELKKAFEDQDNELKAKQEQLEAVMLKFLNDNKTESTRTKSGTVYRIEDVKPSATDWDAVYTFIGENNAWDMIQRRLKKEFITTYMEENDGALPPGVQIHREHVVRVRKA